MELLTNLWSEHHVWLIPLFWMLLSAGINLALRKRTPEEWIAFGKSNPRTAAVIRLMSALGIDPAKAIIALSNLVQTKAAEAKAAAPSAQPQDKENKP